MIISEAGGTEETRQGPLVLDGVDKPVREKSTPSREVVRNKEAEVAGKDKPRKEGRASDRQRWRSNNSGFLRLAKLGRLGGKEVPPEAQVDVDDSDARPPLGTSAVL